MPLPSTADTWQNHLPSPPPPPHPRGGMLSLISQDYWPLKMRKYPEMKGRAKVSPQGETSTGAIAETPIINKRRLGTVLNI
jgi:hypothetical protein